MADPKKNLIRIPILNKSLYTEYGFIGKQVFDKNGEHIGQIIQPISNTKIEIINKGELFEIDLNNNAVKYFFRYMTPWESYLSIMESQGTNNLQNTTGYHFDVESHKDLKEFLGKNDKPPVLGEDYNSKFWNVIKNDDLLGGKRQRKTKRRKHNRRTTKRIKPRRRRHQ
jgi:hypothetical protein